MAGYPRVPSSLLCAQQVPGTRQALNTWPSALALHGLGGPGVSDLSRAHVLLKVHAPPPWSTEAAQGARTHVLTVRLQGASVRVDGGRRDHPGGGEEAGAGRGVRVHPSPPRAPCHPVAAGGGGEDAPRTTGPGNAKPLPVQGRFFNPGLSVESQRSFFEKPPPGSLSLRGFGPWHRNSNVNTPQGMRFITEAENRW